MTKFMRLAFLGAVVLLIVSGIIVIRGIAEPAPSFARPAAQP